MRIATSQMYSRPTSLMTQLTAAADKTQTQIATTKLGITAASDAAAYIKLQQIQRATTGDATYKSNITIAQGVTAQTDQTLESVETQMQRALELATRAKSDTLSASDRASIGEELDSIRDTLFALANTKDDIRGQPLFGGATGDTAYVKNADGSISFAGTGEPSAIPIGDGESVQPTISGERVFSPAGADMFAVLGSLSAALKSGTDVQAAGAAALDGINASLDTVALARASVGARGARLDLQADRLTDVAETRETTRSGIEDTDIPTAVANLQKTLTVLQATQASFTKLTSVSLFDYLK
ncbi:flagellar hook-associated protein 3 FlgL [Sphingomonas kyeonggiensis]|uniref:flagellin N-terminal helical domain-containing protein n=1 Tax=Sphingomonas kyeonggiensis TaxID=1268553 RepID=UPI002782DB3D|nr:flagellin [Sphingomonas kyeonggiensis]MDQ0248511.1 flagellar hook-associated protein 3 FlgL [Sphingomonas kyeonggiensis]